MSNAILCPASNIDAQLHFKATVARAVPIPDWLYTRLLELRLADKPRIRAWGTSARSRLQWDKAKPGDVLLFAKAGKLFARARCHGLLDFAELANALWGSTEWQFLFLLDEPAQIDVPVTRINAALGYAPRFTIQRLQTLTPTQSAKALTELSRGT